MKKGEDPRKARRKIAQDRRSDWQAYNQRMGELERALGQQRTDVGRERVKKLIRDLKPVLETAKAKHEQTKGDL